MDHLMVHEGKTLGILFEEVSWSRTGTRTRVEFLSFPSLGFLYHPLFVKPFPKKKTTPMGCSSRSGMLSRAHLSP